MGAQADSRAYVRHREDTHDEQPDATDFQNLFAQWGCPSMGKARHANGGAPRVRKLERSTARARSGRGRRAQPGSPGMDWYRPSGRSPSRWPAHPRGGPTVANGRTLRGGSRRTTARSGIHHPSNSEDRRPGRCRRLLQGRSFRSPAGPEGATYTFPRIHESCA